VLHFDEDDTARISVKLWIARVFAEDVSADASAMEEVHETDLVDVGDSGHDGIALRMSLLTWPILIC